MARGWESKAVEDQINSAEADKQPRARPLWSERDRKKQAQVDSLLLTKTEISNRLRASRNERYRAQLELALDHIEHKLRELEQDS